MGFAINGVFDGERLSLAELGPSKYGRNDKERDDHGGEQGNHG
ncbi:hypothetical protein M2281_003922 [Mesorhizobium soli]|nr:hypothetical protein [Mesorhizobium soli]